MADLDGVKIRKGKIGANTINNGDGISGLIVACVKPEGLEFGEVVTFFNTIDAESKGITQSFDDANGVNLYRHISEFFRMAGEGKKLYCMVVAADTPMSRICEDVDAQYAKKLLIEADGEVKQIAVAINPPNLAIDPDDPNPPIGVIHLNGLPIDVYNSIAPAQALALWAYDHHFPCQIFLEGYHFKGPALSAADLRALTVKATKVSLVIGQDWQYAETRVGNAQLFAEVGTALGTLSAASINQNMGENESFNLTNAPRKIWLVPGLSSHQKNKDVFNQLQTLEDKGFIFGLSYTGLDGVRWNNDHTCTEIVRDSEGNVNEHTIAFGRTLDKAKRLLRTALLPKVKSTHPVDPTTGKLPVGVIKNFEGIGNTELGRMVAAKEITAGVTIVDPNSDLIVEKTLKVDFRIVPYGSIGEIFGTINLKTNI
ncbi:DUF2586 family protein [Aquimarina latercula]|uniref:DUF2586 family protein n=1 Tax=Aquimarina latercula TaxID=987 RepID=UPI000417B013|nr:DUF2586 family protein [Aquimarina latercula]